MESLDYSFHSHVDFRQDSDDESHVRERYVCSDKSLAGGFSIQVNARNIY